MKDECPIHPKSMVKWRQWVGAEKLESLFVETLRIDLKSKQLDAPEVECISMGKAHKRYEFGCKVSVAKTNESNWVVGVQVLHDK